VYHVLLTNRYLTTRLIPLIAVAAVALCVALVIIVVSVMSGFLDMVRSSGRVLMGDVVVQYPVQGIPLYEELIREIEALPEAIAATPVIDSWGLLKMPYPMGPNKETEIVQIWGIEPESFARVTGYEQTLYWRPLGEREQRDARPDDIRRNTEVMQETYADALTLRDSRTDRPAIVLGMHVSQANERQRDGSYHPMAGGYWWMPNFEVTLTTLPIDTAGGLVQPESFVFPVVNEMMSGVYLIDDTRVMIPLDVAQRLLHLDEGLEVDPEDPEVVLGVFPARATMVLVRGEEGVTPLQLRELVEQAYLRFRDRVSPQLGEGIRLPAPGIGVSVRTWEQQQARFIGPVEKERNLMQILFSIIYIVCAGLVLAIFWAIVQEKTRDIGILRSVGASRFGISLIFLRYGAIIGSAGAIVGLGIAFVIVRNINAIHDAMGVPAPAWLWISVLALAGLSLGVTIWKWCGERMLPAVLWSFGTIVLIGIGLGLSQHKGALVWDPTVYYFATIPNTLDMAVAVTTMIGAVIFSVIGAFVPAAKAADTDPVQALRYE
jgi:lipoprotein-releasing system permease protein